MRTLLALAAVAALALPLNVLADPLPVVGIEQGDGVFADPGELAATIEFSFIDSGCLDTKEPTGLAYIHTVRHFLGFDKARDVYADMQCVPDGDALAQAIVLIGNEQLSPGSNMKLAGTGSPDAGFVLAGTFRDGYMVVHID